jgi:DNA-binding NarL/FixJ family response regulator
MDNDPPSSAARALRVAIVDDHELLRKGLRVFLELQHRVPVVLEAAGIAEACRLLPDAKPNLVVLDLGLPDEDAIAGIRQLRAGWPELGIVVYTGDADEDECVRAVMAGAHAVVRKASPEDELLKAIKLVAGGRPHLRPQGPRPDGDAFRAIPRRAKSARVPILSEREAAVLRRIAEGASYKEIGGELNISAKSVETYRRRLARKLGCGSRAELIRYAVRSGIVGP